MLLSLPGCHRYELSMAFITNFPLSALMQFTVIWLILNNLTTIITYLPWSKYIDTSVPLWMTFEHVICKHQVIDNITTYHFKEFKCYFCDSIGFYLWISHWHLTSFQSQMDMHNECWCQTIQQYLEAFCDCVQGSCFELVPPAEFMYNSCIHHLMLMTPFWVNYNHHSTMQVKLPKNLSFRSQVQADGGIAGQKETYLILSKHVYKAQMRYTMDVSRKKITFAGGNKVWLSTRNMSPSWPSDKVEHNWMGPYMISKIINQHAYKMDLSNTMRKCIIFHVLHLDYYTPLIISQHITDRQFMILRAIESL